MLTSLDQIKTTQGAASNSFRGKKKLNNQAIKQSPPFFFQPKLAIGSSDDIYKTGATAMADKVMRMQTQESINFSSEKNSVQRKCAHCEEEEKQLQKKESSAVSISIAPPIVHDVINSSYGKSLDEGTRSFMEPRFGYDFSTVKIHDSELAAKSANSINALAYTSGSNIVFNSGQYNTTSDAGRKLLAHELTHVVQQKNAKNSISPFVQRDAGCEMRAWPDGCVAPGGCDAGKQCIAMIDWSSCACWDTSGAERRMRQTVPGWIISLLGAAALLALIACFATGVCELGAVIGGLGAAAAAILLAILRGIGLGGTDRRTVANNNDTDTENGSSPEEPV